MAPVPVEAKSLSDVVALAEDPPLTLEMDSTQEPHEKLVLYIARVPGSRGLSILHTTSSPTIRNMGLTFPLDVFLTPMKPREKIVTVSDIESCLYYVHIYGAEDEKLRQALLSESNQSSAPIALETEHRFQGRQSVRRKPLQQELIAPFDNPPGLPPRTFSHDHSPKRSFASGTQTMRKPVGWHARPTVAKSMDLSPEYSAPHLVGPRHMNQRVHSIDDSVLQSSPERLNIDIRRSLEQPPDDTSPISSGPQRKPLLRPNTLEKIEDGAQSLFHFGGDMHPEKTTRLQADTKTSYSCHEQDFSLILIRRHANTQWNVGNISRLSAVTRPNNPISVNHASPAEERQEGTSIEISTAGYAKFVDKGSRTNGKENLNSAQKDPRPMHIRNHEQFTFQRRIQVANFNKMRSQRRVAESGSDSSLSKQHRFSSKFKLHRHSQYMESNERVERLPRQLSPPQPAVDSKGYTFQSPWDGVCEFNVGIVNRSLKCRHTTLPSKTSSIGQIRSVSVSELRFNLPSSKSLSASPSRKSKTWRPSASSRHNSLEPSTYENDRDSSASDDDRLDLSLGQEHAGGGFGGKQAKLGKLIIENEGLKMLDLLVAANIGIWWRVYEKTYILPERVR